jgi:outer membrane protein OmpA-like peptidoglycan-associated protein
VAGRLGVEYRAAMRGLRAPLTGAQLVVTLPEGVDHEPGTSALDGAAIPDPAVEGRTLAYPLGDLPAEWSKVVTFRARAMEKMGAGEHAAIAFVSGDGQGGLRVEAPPAENALRVATEEVRGPLKFVTRPHFPSFGARLGGGDRAELARVAGKLRRIRPKHLVVVGHTDSRPIAERSRKIYADNSALSLARAESVRAFLMDSLGMTAEQIDVEGKGESEPMADNATARGRALNRRVEVHIHEPETVDVATLVQPEGKEEATSAAEGVAPGAPGVVVERASSTLPAPGPRSPAASGTAAVPGAGAAPPATGSPVATSAEAGAQSAGTSAPTAPAPKATPADGFTSPADGDLVPDRVTAVQLRLPSYLTPALAVDGQEVPADRIGYRSVDPRTGKTVYTYVGVDLGEKGSRTLTVTGKDPFGNVRLSQSATVIRTGEIASIRFLSAEGNVADGRTPVRARIELRDESGDPIRGATNLVLRGGTLRPLRLDGETLTVEDAAAGRVVRMDKDGWVLFDPVTASGSHRALLACGGATVQVETWARPELRDWILVGLAEGTAGYAAVTGNMETLEAADAPEDLYADGRVAFYAKGRIKGSWLLTLAYDSDRPAPGEGDGLFQQIDPQTYFTLYGDGSTQERDAPSIRKVYVKIERDQFYVLFGDHDTGLTVTELSRYVRKLNGVKAELRTRNIEVAAFGTQTDAIHVRDEIPGDGTSGLYRLSRGRVTPNSETVTLLTRDRFRSEVVVVARTLTRFIDYSIDFDRGTLFFREPIPSRDLEFNPITIVVEYETVASGEDVTLGGRAGVRLLDDRLRAGVTAVHEGQGDVQNDLYGADLRLDLGTHTRLRGELALTDERGPGADGGGNAYLAEVAHASRRLEAKAYFRLQETGFGLGQQALSEAGTRKYGVEARYRFTDRLSLGGQAYQQDTFATGAERLVGEARLAYASGPWSGHVGLLQASDQLADGSRHDSGQINVGGKLLALKDRLTLGVDWAQSVWGNDNVDFPTRVALRAEYKLTSAIALTAAEELTWGDEATTQTTRLGLRSSLWKGGSLTSSVARDLREDDSRIFGNVGLRQTLQLSDAWKVDAGLERSQTVLEDGWYQPNPAVPPAHGTTGEDFTAISAGGSYQVPRLVWDSRAELRLGSDEDKLSVLTGVVAERQGGWGFSGRGQVLATRGDAGDTTSGNLRFGLVYRPARTRWILLNRLDWLLERGVPTVGGPAPGDLARADSWRIVDNFLANHRPRKDLQVSLGYGAKWVHQRIEGEVHEGYTDQGSLEVRYDLSPGWDLGLRGSLLHVWNAGQLSFSGGPSVGYSPATNVWLGVGFNVSGYEDRDLSASSHTAYGPWVRMRFKFDQESVREAAAWLNRQ